MGELLELQKAFTEHLRNPDITPVPHGLDKRRMGIYSELIFSNVSSLLSEFFPVIKSILPEDRWDRMVRDFFISHQSQTPYFMEIQGEFVEYLSQSQLIGDLPDFLLELAHYEWVELALYTMDEDVPDEGLSDEELANCPLVMSPLVQPLAYQYPVHQIREDFQPAAPADSPTYLLVLRNAEESIKFYELQPFSFMFLLHIQGNPGLEVQDWLMQQAADNKIENKSEFLHNGIDLLKSFNAHKVFLKG